MIWDLWSEFFLSFHKPYFGGGFNLAHLSRYEYFSFILFCADRFYYGRYHIRSKCLWQSKSICRYLHRKRRKWPSFLVHSTQYCRKYWLDRLLFVFLFFSGFLFFSSKLEFLKNYFSFTMFFFCDINV